MNKLLITSHSYKFNLGGASKRNFYLAKYLSKSYDVYLIDWYNISFFRNQKKIYSYNFSWIKFLKILFFEKIHISLSDTIKFGLLPLPNLYFTIHDMREWSAFSRQSILKKILLKYIIKKCRKLITVSDYQKKVIKKVLKKKSYVIENGISDDWDIKKVNYKKKIMKKKYVIYVSNFTKNKNHLSLQKQTKILKAYKIVLIGSVIDQDGERIFKILKSKNYIIMKNISEAKLVNLIYHSEFVLFPSLYEGYGIPILEAIKLNKKVLVNNSPSLRHFKKFRLIKYVNFNKDLKKSDISWANTKYIKKKSLTQINSWEIITEQMRNLFNV